MFSHLSRLCKGESIHIWYFLPPEGNYPPKVTMVPHPCSYIFYLVALFYLFIALTRHHGKDFASYRCRCYHYLVCSK